MLELDGVECCAILVLTVNPGLMIRRYVWPLVSGGWV